MKQLYYRDLFLQLLFLETNPKGLAFLEVQIAKGYFRTFVAELANTSETLAALIRFIADTKLLHLWLLSAPGPEQLLIPAPNL